MATRREFIQKSALGAAGLTLVQRVIHESLVQMTEFVLG